MSFSEDDLEQIKAHGLDGEAVRRQIEIFKKGVPFTELIRPATVGDGIVQIDRRDLKSWAEVFQKAAFDGRAMKFVPASGAASRMFAFLSAAENAYPDLTKKDLESNGGAGGFKRETRKFFERLKDFPFYDELQKKLKASGHDLDRLIGEGAYAPLLSHVLHKEGLNYAHLPKALLTFHRYRDHVRTPIEEHFVEAMTYTEDNCKRAHIHFTVSAEFREAVDAYAKRARKWFHEHLGSDIRYGVSIQKPSTDTLAVDMDNEPFRAEDGKLVFRPGGHGALLENVSNLGGDIVFIKNIDNVTVDKFKYDTYLYKRALGGYLLSLQAGVYPILEKLEKGDVSDSQLNDLFAFTAEKLFCRWPQEIYARSREEKIRLLFDKLNRPFRVCGMVKNEGEPGGGPYWARLPNGTESLQIVERSEVNTADGGQKKILDASTHFNPVDLVCGVKDYRGKAFDLTRFREERSVFISEKSKEGRKLKALEHPGLWNGGMAHWNTVFVEVPISTFSPAKTVNDLLRKEHQ